MERSPEEGLPLRLRRQGVQFKEKISKTKRRDRDQLGDSLVYSELQFSECGL